jgi:hypothetical protein
MFKWYEESAVCYAYLADVHPTSDEMLHYVVDLEFRNSEWFTRGWTLQELLAPKSVIFYDHEWTEMGTNGSSQFLVSDVIGINRLVSFEVRL